MIVGRDHIEYGGAFDFVQVIKAEHFQIGAVGKNMHAFVHVGNCIARAFHQHPRAFFTFAELDFVVLRTVAGFQLRQLALDDQLQVLGLIIGTQVICAQAHGFDDIRFIAGLADGDQWYMQLAFLEFLD